MTDPVIRYVHPGLNECTDPQAADWLHIVDVSAAAGDEDRKVAVGKLAVLGLANTFTAAQTIPRVTPPQTLLAADGTISVGLGFGLLLVMNLAVGSQALIWLGGGANSLLPVSVRGGISTTKDTANFINVYYESGTYKIQNKYATSQTLAYMIIGIA